VCETVAAAGGLSQSHLMQWTKVSKTTLSHSLTGTKNHSAATTKWTATIAAILFLCWHHNCRIVVPLPPSGLSPIAPLKEQAPKSAQTNQQPPGCPKCEQ